MKYSLGGRVDIASDTESDSQEGPDSRPAGDLFYR